MLTRPAGGTKILAMTHPRSLLVLRLAALLALGVSVALLIDSMRPQPAFCALGSGCDKIRQLGYGSVAGVPVPALGIASFSGLLSLSFVPEPWAAKLTGGGAMLGGLIAASLIAMQALVLGAFCKLCMVTDSAAIVAAVAGFFVLRADPAERKEGALMPWAGLLIAAVGVPWGLSSLSPAPPVPRQVLSVWKPGAVNVVEFSDFECPFCRQAHPVLESALHKTSDLKINFVRKTMPLPSHPNARDASRAYLCADAQGKGDAMADRLFTQVSLSRSGLEDAARQLELPLDAFRACLDDKATDQRVDEHIAFVRNADFKGLPTVWINSQRLLGAQEEHKYVEAIRKAASGSESDGSVLPLAFVLLASVGLVALGRKKTEA